MQIVDCIGTTFKKRQGPNRKFILICMLLIVMQIVPYIGEFSIDYYFVRTVFEWGVTQYSTYSFVVSAASLIGIYC